MEISQDIERERDNLINELEKHYSCFSLSQLVDLVDTIENFLKEYLRVRLLSFSKECCNSTFNLKTNVITSSDGIAHELVLLDDPEDSSYLQVSYIPRLQGVRKKNFQHKTIKIDSYGKYQRVRLILPKTLNFDEEILSKLLIAIYETGHAWVTEKIKTLILQEEISIANDLYNLIKFIFPNKELRNNCWFACVTEKFGFRLIEREVVYSAFDIIKENSQGYGISTNKLVANLISTRLPKDGLLMYVAQQVNRCIEGKISEARYSKEGDIYAYTMMSLYGASTFTIYPVYVSETLSVFVLYPNDKKSEIEPRLEANKTKLINKIENSCKRLYKAEKIFNPPVKSIFSLKSLNEFLMLEPNIAGLGIRMNKIFDFFQRKKS